jgi:hypothetical protein
MLLAAASAGDRPPLGIEGLANTPMVTPRGEHAPDVISERWWQQDANGIQEAVAELRLRKRVTPKVWLARWRASHGCVAEVTRAITPIAWLKARQLTFRGRCKGGDNYLIHVVVLDKTIVELHVSTMERGVTDTRLEEALRSLLARVHPPRVEGRAAPSASSPAAWPALLRILRSCSV